MKRKYERQLENIRKTTSNQKRTVDSAEIARNKIKSCQEDLKEKKRKRDAEDNQKEIKKILMEDNQARKETLSLPENLQHHDQTFSTSSSR